MLLHMLFDCISLTRDDSLHQWVMQLLSERSPIKKKDNFNNKYQELADKAIEESEKLIASPGWSVEVSQGENAIYSKIVPGVGKVFKYEGIINVEAELLNERLFFNAEKCPEWNRNIKKAEVIQNIDKQTYIVHFVSHKEFIISTRDFIHLRTFRRRGDSILNCSFSINYPGVPTNPNYTRGSHRFCTYSMYPVKNNPSKSYIVWLMQVTLNGWIPQHLTDYAISSGMLRHIEDLSNLKKK